MKELKITLTGGGTAGHVMPHLALLPFMRKSGWIVNYIGSNGIEKKLIQEAGLSFKTIRSGKLRRYFSWQNFFDLFNVAIGLVQTLIFFLFHRPDVVFSKGGYVTVPVVVAAWILRIPVVAHESDFTPGLATKIAGVFAGRILFTFPETEKYLIKNRSTWVGTPIRSELSLGERSRGFAFLGFDLSDTRPVILVMGGSQGAQKINRLIENCLDQLLIDVRVVHLTGKGKKSQKNLPGYAAYEFLGSELADVLAASDCVIGRAGANSIFEFLYLSKPMLLIPLEEGSRGDQVHNAKSFESKGWAKILRENNADSTSFLKATSELLKDRFTMAQSQLKTRPDMNSQRILEVLIEEANF